MTVYACVRILDFWAMCFKFDGFGFDFYFCFVKFLCSCSIVFSLLSLILFPLSSQVLFFIFLVLSCVTISISSSVLVLSLCFGLVCVQFTGFCQGHSVYRFMFLVYNILLSGNISCLILMVPCLFCTMLSFAYCLWSLRFLSALIPCCVLIV